MDIKQVDIGTLIGDHFLKKKGETEREKEMTLVTDDCGLLEITRSKFIGLFFSAHWCPPCQNFLPILKDFYSEVNLDDKEFEVLFISTDKTEDDFKEHYKSMPWLAIPYADPRIKQLLNKYKVVGIP